MVAPDRDPDAPQPAARRRACGARPGRSHRKRGGRVGGDPEEAREDEASEAAAESEKLKEAAEPAAAEKPAESAEPAEPRRRRGGIRGRGDDSGGEGEGQADGRRQEALPLPDQQAGLPLSRGIAQADAGEQARRSEGAAREDRRHEAAQPGGARQDRAVPGQRRHLQERHAGGRETPEPGAELRRPRPRLRAAGDLPAREPVRADRGLPQGDGDPRSLVRGGRGADARGLLPEGRDPDPDAADRGGGRGRRAGGEPHPGPARGMAIAAGARVLPGQGLRQDGDHPGAADRPLAHQEELLAPALGGVLRARSRRRGALDRPARLPAGPARPGPRDPRAGAAPALERPALRGRRR